MSKYSIKDLEHLSGIKAHTIRIWEKRYNLLNPDRTNTNIRYYNDEMLKKILNVSSLINSGFKISKISAMSGQELIDTLFKIVAEPVDDGNIENHIHDLIKICLSFDSENLDIKIKEIISQRDLEYCFEYIFVPLLQRIGHLWTTNMFSPSHEHFLSNKIKEVLFFAIANTTVTRKQKILLFLPQWEEHEIILLFCNYLLKKEGYNTVYLGTKVPDVNLLETISVLQPDFIVTHLTTSNQSKSFKKYLDLIPDNCKMNLSGNEDYMPLISMNKNLSWVKNIEEFKNILFV